MQFADSGFHKVQKDMDVDQNERRSKKGDEDIGMGTDFTQVRESMEQKEKQSA